MVILSLLPLHSQHDGGKLKLIEQNELYASNPDPDQDLLNPHRDHDIISKLSNKSTHCKEDGAKSVIDSLKGTKLPDSVLEPVLHARSVAMSKFPSDVKPVLTMEEADEFVAQRDKNFPEMMKMMKRNDSMSSIASSPVSALSPDSGTGSMGGASPTATTSRGSVASRNGSLSSSSVASPLSSVSSPPISPPTQSSTAPSPNALASGGVTEMRLDPAPTSGTTPSPNPLTSAQQTATPPLVSANGHGAVGAANGTKSASLPTTANQFTQLQRERPMGSTETVPMGVREYLPLLTAPSSSGSSPSFAATASNIATSPTMEDQKGVQSPPSVGSSLSSSISVSSPPSSTGIVSATQQQPGGFAASDGQFIGNGGGGSFSETPSPYNSAISTVSSPPSVFSPEGGMGTNTLHTAVSTDSIPAMGSTTLPFQSFHTPNSFPQSTTSSVSNSFNTQIPSNFNFNSTTSAYHPTTTTTAPANLQNSTSFAANFNSFAPGPESQLFDNSSDPLLNPNDPIMHQLLSDIVAMNSDPSFNNTVASVPVPAPTNYNNATTVTSMNTSFVPHTHTHSHPQAPANYYNFATTSPNNSHASAVLPPSTSLSSQLDSSGGANSTFAMSCDIALTQLNVGSNDGVNGMAHLLADPQIANSNPEVQDILQQFQ